MHQIVWPFKFCFSMTKKPYNFDMTWPFKNIFSIFEIHFSGSMFENGNMSWEQCFFCGNFSHFGNKNKSNMNWTKGFFAKKYSRITIFWGEKAKSHHI
jgi:hypothetical protein